jgi:hypothetical protein
MRLCIGRLCSLLLQRPKERSRRRSRLLDHHSMLLSCLMDQIDCRIGFGEPCGLFAQG